MTEFKKKLDELKDWITERAGGVTCATCKHAEFGPGDVGFCQVNEHILRWGPITISSWAPKCAKYESCAEDSVTIELSVSLSA
jgi:hypothetical protein